MRCVFFRSSFFVWGKFELQDQFSLRFILDILFFLCEFFLCARVCVLICVRIYVCVCILYIYIYIYSMFYFKIRLI